MRKILVIKLSSLGDVMIAVPHLETIIGHHGGDEVWFMTSPSFASLFSDHPRLHLVVLDRKRHFGRTGLMRSVLWMRRQKLSVIYDLQGNRISRLLVRFGGAGTTVGTQPKSIYNCHPIDSYTRNTERNVFDRLNETLVSADIPVYSFFGPTSWIRSYAVGQRDRVLWQDVGCGPCFQDVCPERRGHICLQSITPETVFNRIDAELNLSG